MNMCFTLLFIQLYRRYITFSWRNFALLPKHTATVNAIFVLLQNTFFHLSLLHIIYIVKNHAGRYRKLFLGREMQQMWRVFLLSLFLTIL